MSSHAVKLFTNRSHGFSLGLLLSFVFVVTSAGPALSATFQISDDSRIWFDARTQIEQFHGYVDNFSGTITFDADQPFQNPQAIVRVPVKSLDTRIDERNQHMRDLLSVDRYPLIEFNLTNSQPDTRASSEHQDDRLITGTRISSPESSEQQAGQFHGWKIDNKNIDRGRAMGKFTIRGETRDVDLPVLINNRGDSILVRSDIKLDVTEFGITPPSFLYVVSVYPTVKIHARLVLNKTRPY